MRTASVELLGRFAVTVDGRGVDAADWRGRPAVTLVKVLALAADRRLHREQVIDALWPDATLDEAAPRLHKAVHHARRALGGNDTVDTAGGSLVLLPHHAVVVDAVEFERAATEALDRDDPAARAAALAACTAELLPEDRYEPWAEAARDRLAHLHRQLLRADGRWSELLAVDPTDEGAHVAVMRTMVERGDRAGALAQYDRLEEILEREIGVAPGATARELRATALALPTASGAIAPLPPQQVRFCRARDGLQLAYAVTGSGPPLVKAANWMTHLEYDWESTLWRHWLAELSARHSLLRYDVRGCGMSDWNTTSFTQSAWIDDLESVVDAAGYERFPLLGVSQGAAVAVEYAVRHPERVQALVLYGSYVHGPVARAVSDEERRTAEMMPQLAELGWGNNEPSFRQVFTSRFMPDGDRARWDEFNELQRRSTTPANAARFMRGFANIDVTAAAERVSCPTLVVHARGDLMPPLREGRLLAGLIPGSRFVSLDGNNHILLDGEPAWPRFLAEMEAFLADVT